jgi:hypothetical protein
MQYTAEQEEIFDIFLNSTDNLAVIAYAGAGKTTTVLEAVRLYLKKFPKARIALIYFNKAARQDAEARINAMGLEKNVSVWTNHTIPFVTIGQRYAENHRLLGIDDSMCRRWRSEDIASYLGITDFNSTLEGKSYVVKAEQIARFAQQAVNKFVTTADWKLTDWHVPSIPALEEIMGDLKPIITTAAQALWKDKRSPVNGKVSISHDDYLKMFAMSDDDKSKWYPRKDMIISDEYQDTNPAQFSILRRHPHFRQVGVGDPYQAIYGFRNAKDYLRKFDEIKRKGVPVPHQTAYLTATHRFAGEIAREANKWLTYCEAEKPLIGLGSFDGELEENMQDPDLYLTRTNSGAILAALDMINAERTYSIHGGSDTIRDFANGAAKLMCGESSEHPELNGFTSWEHFVKFTEEDPSGNDLRTIQRIITKHGIEDITRLADNASIEGEAETHIATFFTQKGRQAEKVKIASDCAPRLDKNDQIIPPSLVDAYGYYVAVTRAECYLDRGPLDVIDDLIDDVLGDDSDDEEDM